MSMLRVVLKRPPRSLSKRYRFSETRNSDSVNSVVTSQSDSSRKHDEDINLLRKSCDLGTLQWSLYHTKKNCKPGRINPRMIAALRPIEKSLGCHVRHFAQRPKPFVSEVLTSYLLQTNEPPWTSYFVKYADVKNDQWGMTYFNWPVGKSNYHILRIGCYPYIKYHCTKRPHEDLSFEDKFYKTLKILNIGIPSLAYGLIATQLIRHTEVVKTGKGDVPIYFLIPEDKGSQY